MKLACNNKLFMQFSRDLGDNLIEHCVISVNNILFKYKVDRDTTDTSYIQYNTFERDTEISLRLV